MSGRRKKQLLDLVKGGTFRARHHADRLLREPPVPGYPSLLRIQQRYRAAAFDDERAALAREYEREQQREQQLPLADFLYTSCGPALREEDLFRDGEEFDDLAFEVLRASWQLWNHAWGTFWRTDRGIFDGSDVFRWYHALTDGEKSADTYGVVESEFPRLEWDALDAMFEARARGELPEEIPGPPDPAAYVGRGLELLTESPVSLLPEVERYLSNKDKAKHAELAQEAALAIRALSSAAR